MTLFLIVFIKRKGIIHKGTNVSLVTVPKPNTSPQNIIQDRDGFSGSILKIKKIKIPIKSIEAKTIKFSGATITRP